MTKVGVTRTLDQRERLTLGPHVKAPVQGSEARNTVSGACVRQAGNERRELLNVRATVPDLLNCTEGRDG
jgi:hypothetical protein